MDALAVSLSCHSKEFAGVRIKPFGHTQEVQRPWLGEPRTLGDPTRCLSHRTVNSPTCSWCRDPWPSPAGSRRLQQQPIALPQGIQSERTSRQACTNIQVKLHPKVSMTANLHSGGLGIRRSIAGHILPRLRPDNRCHLQRFAS
eukprot:s2628_g15.t1